MDFREVGEESLYGMRASIFRAAGLLHGSEFHQFNSGVVGVVEIELPFAVATNLGLLAGLPTVFDQPLPCGFDVRNAEGDVIHYAEGMMIRVDRNIKHILDPVGPFRNVHVDPVSFAVLHSAVPIDAKSEEVLVEGVFGSAIAHDKSGMYYVIAGLHSAIQQAVGATAR